MPSDLLSCPYCNTSAAVPPGAVPGQRIPCPRCGESFPYRGPAIDGAITASPPPAFAPPDEPADPPAPRRLSNGRIAFLVLGVMAGMALLGLAYALNTQTDRRAYDEKLPKSQAILVPWVARAALIAYVVGLVGAVVWGWNRGERAGGRAEARPWTGRLSVPVLAVLALVGIGLALVAIPGRPARQGLDIDKTLKAVPPAELAALGYLPDDTDLIVGVHVAEALRDPAGRDLLQRAGGGDLEKWTGLRLDEIDHAVLGLKLDPDSLLTHFVLVARARRPIEEQRVRDALKAGPKQTVGSRTVYPFDLRVNLNLPFVQWLDVRAQAWFADEYTLVIAKEKEFDRIPLAPKAGIDHLRPALRQVIKERMGPSAQVWAAARVESWDDKKLSPLVIGGLAAALKDAGVPLKTVQAVRTAAVWLTADDGVTLRAAFDCADEDGAKALEAYFDPKDGKGLKALAARPDAGPMARELVGSLKTTRHATWVDLQAKVSAQAVRGPEK
jgi:hypothetical protein